ncbi:hypothetical protein PR048_016706 [Dryococelus australis]|uniref:Uncharacterized protein n=1 Tax=Dryococelus australis TaxID=614101 RepID=A0ABQ9H7P5_9NEOP|nr:hypothetical protein PR048_016706 [Dryococelus australis]
MREFWEEMYSVTHKPKIVSQKGPRLAQRLERSPPTKGNRVRILVGPPELSHVGILRTMLLVEGFSPEDLPFPPLLHSGAAPYSLRLTHPIVSLDHVVKSRACVWFHAEDGSRSPGDHGYQETDVIPQRQAGGGGGGAGDLVSSFEPRRDRRTNEPTKPAFPAIPQAGWHVVRPTPPPTCPHKPAEVLRVRDKGPRERLHQRWPIPFESLAASVGKPLTWRTPWQSCNELSWDQIVIRYQQMKRPSHFKASETEALHLQLGGNPDNPMVTKSGDIVWHSSSESIVYIQNSIKPLDSQRIKEYVTLSKDCKASRAARQDVASSRYHLDVRALPNETFVGRCICRGGSVEYPAPTSPDLALLFLSASNSDEHCARYKTMDFGHHERCEHTYCLRSHKQRCKRCVAAGGGLFEHLFDIPGGWSSFPSLPWRNSHTLPRTGKEKTDIELVLTHNPRNLQAPYSSLVWQLKDEGTGLDTLKILSTENGALPFSSALCRTRKSRLFGVRQRNRKKILTDLAGSMALLILISKLVSGSETTGVSCCNFFDVLACRGGVVGYATRLPRRRTGFNSRRGQPLIYTCGNHAGGCCWSAGFLGHLPFPSPLHSDTASYSLRSTLIGSQDLDFKNHATLRAPGDIQRGVPAECVNSVWWHVTARSREPMRVIKVWSCAGMKGRAKRENTEANRVQFPVGSPPDVRMSVCPYVRMSVCGHRAGRCLQIENKQNVMNREETIVVTVEARTCRRRGCGWTLSSRGGRVGLRNGRREIACRGHVPARAGPSCGSRAKPRLAGVTCERAWPLAAASAAPRAPASRSGLFHSLAPCLKCVLYSSISALDLRLIRYLPVHNVCSVVVAPLESRRATSCGYNSSHPVWHALYEGLQDIHGDSSPFLLQPFHELSNGFWPRLTSPHLAIQFVPKMFYRVEVEALGGPVQSANIVVGVQLHSSP